MSEQKKKPSIDAYEDPAGGFTITFSDRNYSENLESRELAIERLEELSEDGFKIPELLIPFLRKEGEQNMKELSQKFKDRAQKLLDLHKKVKVVLAHHEVFEYKTLWQIHKEYRKDWRRLRSQINRAYMDIEKTDEEHEELLENNSLVKRCLETEEELCDLIRELNRPLFNLENVEFEPSDNIWNRIKTSRTSTYRSQGYGAGRYAKAALIPEQKVLEEKGFKTHIRSIPQCNKDGKQYGTVYELWSNGPEWMLDAATRTLTIGKAADILSEDNIHPQVVMPIAYNHPKVKDPNWGGN